MNRCPLAKSWTVCPYIVYVKITVLLSFTFSLPSSFVIFHTHPVAKSFFRGHNPTTKRLIQKEHFCEAVALASPSKIDGTYTFIVVISRKWLLAHGCSIGTNTFNRNNSIVSCSLGFQRWLCNRWEITLDDSGINKVERNIAFICGGVKRNP